MAQTRREPVTKRLLFDFYISSGKTINVDDAITCGWRDPCANYTADNVHFSEVGYQLLAKAVMAA
jgi:lysophospholipase L1-like esterase